MLTRVTSFQRQSFIVIQEMWTEDIFICSLFKLVKQSHLYLLPHTCLAAQFLATLTRCFVFFQHAQGDWHSCHTCTGASALDCHTQHLQYKDNTTRNYQWNWNTDYKNPYIILTAQPDFVLYPHELKWKSGTSTSLNFVSFKIWDSRDAHTCLASA